MTRYGYARIAPTGQSLADQTEALKASGCVEVFVEQDDDPKGDRLQLPQLLDRLGDGDVLTVTRLDHLSRSTRDLMTILDRLGACGASFCSLSEPWADTSAPQGRLMLEVLGGVAEFQRETLRARANEGRARARARGKHMGRPPSLTTEQRQEAVKALMGGSATQAELARIYGVSQSTISRRADKAALAAKPAVQDDDYALSSRAFMERVKEQIWPGRVRF
jgi:DNA invertase Pin-like site-specific DNA recombinase